MENIQLIYPEIFLSIIAMLLLMVGVFKQKAPTVNLLLGVSAFAILVSIYILFAVDFKTSGEDGIIFNGAFQFNNFSTFMKVMASIATLSVCFISINNSSFAGENKNCFEYPVILLLSLIGANLLISANDLIAVYLGLELLSLSSYVLVALNRDNDLASEGAVKYFILGALASGLILFGSSLVYGFAGDTNLTKVFEVVNAKGSVSEALGLTLGLTLVFAGFIFKISAAPMHMWAPDVYSATAKPVLAYLSTVPKVAAIAFLIRLVVSQPEFLQNSFSIIIIIISILSMIIGSFAGLRQENIKRLLAYSSIANMGYLLIALSVATSSAISAALFYLAVYMVTMIGVFSIIVNINKDDKVEDKISNLSGLARTNPFIAALLAIMMFSMAGIPPMAGFFAKFFVFIEAISSENYTLAIIGVVSSVVACFYYLRIIKVMYFDEPSSINYASKATSMTKVISLVSVVFLLTLIFYVDKFLALSKVAVSAIF